MWEPGAQVLDQRFRIISALGKPGLTEAYLAEQLSLHRQVLLRVFHAVPGARPPSTERFDQEVRRLAKVDHPAVLRVIDSGQWQTTRFVVSALSEGSRLADELKGEPLLPERALELLTQVAEGLAAIHASGLFHGELRAATVMLGKGLKGEQAMLSDFGLGPLTEPDSPDAATVVGQVVGPFEHLAPAQLAGAKADVEGDLYALGVLGYQLLSGVLPIRPIPKPLAEAAPHLVDQVALCELVMRCLDPDPVRRPASATETAKWLAGLPRPADPTIFLETMQRPPPVPAAKTPVAPPSNPSPMMQPPPLPEAPAPSGPRPLLASVQTMAIPIEVAKAELAAPAEALSAPPRKPLLFAGVGLAVAVALGLLLYNRGGAQREARSLVEHRQPQQALEVIGKAQRKLSEPDPDLVGLRAAALHLSDAHADEVTAFKSLPAGAHAALDPLVLSGLVEDFSKREDPALRGLLDGLGKKPLHAVLERFAQEPLSPRQWGALRYLDLSGNSGLGVVALYSASLESNDCGVRKTAAKRLGELMDDAAEAALNRLRDAPREGLEKNCGQDEALAALLALKKSR